MVEVLGIGWGMVRKEVGELRVILCRILLVMLKGLDIVLRVVMRYWRIGIGII